LSDTQVQASAQVDLKLAKVKVGVTTRPKLGQSQLARIREEPALP